MQSLSRYIAVSHSVRKVVRSYLRKVRVFALLSKPRPVNISLLCTNCYNLRVLDFSRSCVASKHATAVIRASPRLEIFLTSMAHRPVLEALTRCPSLVGLSVGEYQIHWDLITRFTQLTALGFGATRTWSHESSLQLRTVLRQNNLQILAITNWHDEWPELLCELQKPDRLWAIQVFLDKIPLTSVDMRVFKRFRNLRVLDLGYAYMDTVERVRLLSKQHPFLQHVSYGKSYRVQRGTALARDLFPNLQARDPGDYQFDISQVIRMSTKQTRHNGNSSCVSRQFSKSPNC